MLQAVQGAGMFQFVTKTLEAFSGVLFLVPRRHKYFFLKCLVLSVNSAFLAKSRL